MHTAILQLSSDRDGILPWTAVWDVLSLIQCCRRSSVRADSRVFPECWTRDRNYSLRLTV